MRRNLRFAPSITISHHHRLRLHRCRRTQMMIIIMLEILALYFYFVLMDASLWDKFPVCPIECVLKSFMNERMKVEERQKIDG